ncbi:MAG: ATP-binding cassette domain-containing protein [Betaproteobacteria bacterium]|nr:ATP-binding cassette domain-containing protein [Betaproteobacteria bacterium]
MPARSFAKVPRPKSSLTPLCKGHTLAIRLQVDAVHAGYGAVKALQGVTLSLEQGQTVALLGTNGNGKSTLMKCLMGMVRPTAGQIVLDIDGQRHDLAKLSTEAIVNLGVALVPEGRRLFPKLSVQENLLLGAFRPSARRPTIPSGATTTKTTSKRPTTRTFNSLEIVTVTICCKLESRMAPITGPIQWDMPPMIGIASADTAYSRLKVEAGSM